MRLAVTLLLALALLAPLAHAGSDTPETPPIPLPQEADAGRYRILREGEVAGTLTFAWRPARFPDAWGREVAGYEVMHDLRGATCVMAVGDVQVGNGVGDPLSAVVRYLGSPAPLGAGSDNLCIAGALVDADNAAVGAPARNRFAYDAWPSFACLFRHGLQGQRADESANLTLLCGREGGWRIAGPEAVGDLAAVRFVREADDGPTSLWLVPGLAYPLAMETSGSVRYELEALRLEGPPLAPPAELPPPALALAPLDALLGPDDAQSGLPLSLREAALSATQDPSLLALRAVLAKEGAALADAQMHARTPVGAPATNAAWVLRYAAPGGASAVVTCQAPAGAPALAIRCVEGSEAGMAAAPDVPPAEFGAASLPPVAGSFAMATERWRATASESAQDPILVARYRAWSDEDGAARVLVGTTNGGAAGAPGARAESSASLSLEGRSVDAVATATSPIYVEDFPDGLPMPEGVERAPGASPAGALAPLSRSAIAGGVVAAVALAALVALAIKGGMLGFFTRLVRPRILDQEVRAAVHALVQQRPGAHAAQIAESLGRAQNVVDHHLDVLVREGFLTRLDTPGFRRYFVTGRFSHAEMRAMAALAEGQAEKLYRIIEANPGIHLAELAQRAGISEAYASRSAKKLAKAGLVDSARVGRTVRFHALER